MHACINIIIIIIIRIERAIVQRGPTFQLSKLIVQIVWLSRWVSDTHNVSYQMWPWPERIGAILGPIGSVWSGQIVWCDLAVGWVKAAFTSRERDWDFGYVTLVHGDDQGTGKVISIQININIFINPHISLHSVIIQSWIHFSAGWRLERRGVGLIEDFWFIIHLQIIVCSHIWKWEASQVRGRLVREWQVAGDQSRD